MKEYLPGIIFWSFISQFIAGCFYFGKQYSFIMSEVMSIVSIAVVLIWLGIGLAILCFIIGLLFGFTICVTI